MKSAEKQSQNTSSSLDRALELLEYLASTCSSMNISEISKLLNITRVTAQTMVNSLLFQNYLERDAQTGRYAIGYKMFEIGNMYRYRFPFLKAAEKHVISFSQKYKVKINICVLKPALVAVILLSREDSIISAPVYGQLLPAYASASGKLLLAHTDPELCERNLKLAPLKRFTPKTIIDPDELLAQLEEIREKGYARSYEELVLERSCIAAPIRDISGQVIASVSFSETTERFAQEENWTNNIIMLSKLISAELGYNDITPFSKSWTTFPLEEIKGTEDDEAKEGNDCEKAVNT